LLRAGYRSGGWEVYWSEFTTHSVKRANLDGTSVQTIFTASLGEYPAAIDIDQANGKVYWSACSGPIRRANLDGSNMEVIPLASGEDCIDGLAVDPVEGRIYWTKEVLGTLHTAALDGYAAEVLKTGLISPEQVALVQGFGVTLRPVDIPAASTWGLVVLGLSIGIAATGFLRTRRLEVT
jgi:hypothetical protein